MIYKKNNQNHFYFKIFNLEIFVITVLYFYHINIFLVVELLFLKLRQFTRARNFEWI